MIGAVSVLAVSGPYSKTAGCGGQRLCSPYDAGLRQAFLGASNFRSAIGDPIGDRGGRLIGAPLFDAAECDAQHKNAGDKERAAKAACPMRRFHRHL